MLEVNLQLPNGESLVLAVTPTKTPVDAPMQDITPLHQRADRARA